MHSIKKKSTAHETSKFKVQFIVKYDDNDFPVKEELSMHSEGELTEKLAIEFYINDLKKFTPELLERIEHIAVADIFKVN